ncbi:MAG: 3-deoxy-7-phosphoheptulonate synthase [Candidatus Omnitrophica bacterium]|nr:3-deoxy-7-phosphoheptulonate synthase [Candidatus Omnitrophota bacterium]
MKDISPGDLEKGLPLVSKRDAAHKTVVNVGTHAIGRSNFTVIAGPCAVESQGQIVEIAHRVKALGAHLLRGGAFKPLTFPYRSSSVFELREEGLRYLKKAGEEAGLPVVTEVMDPRLVERVASCADMLQIGARNMQNFPLLEAVAETGMPVLLKRHFGCSLRDWLGAAEYLLKGGNPNVVLCERGIVAPHTHQPASRFIVDLQVVPAAQEMTHLPILVDPSHSTFRRAYVAPVARAACAIGADGVLVDVHPAPEQAAVDPLQALGYPDFERLIQDLRGICKVVGREFESSLAPR